MALLELQFTCLNPNSMILLFCVVS